MFHLMKILNFQDLLQNRSLETVPVCIVWQCFPHDNMFAILCVMDVKEIKRDSRFVTCFAPFSD